MQKMRNHGYLVKPDGNRNDLDLGDFSFVWKELVSFDFCRR